MNIWAVRLEKSSRMENGSTQTNGPEDKKVDDDAQGISSER